MELKCLFGKRDFDIVKKQYTIKKIEKWNSLNNITISKETNPERLTKMRLSNQTQNINTRLYFTNEKVITLLNNDLPCSIQDQVTIYQFMYQNEFYTINVKNTNTDCEVSDWDFEGFLSHILECKKIYAPRLMIGLLADILVTYTGYYYLIQKMPKFFAYLILALPAIGAILLTGYFLSDLFGTVIFNPKKAVRISEYKKMKKKIDGLV